MRIVGGNSDGEWVPEGTRVIIDQFSAHMRMRHFSPQTVKRRRSSLATFQRFIEPVPLLRADIRHVEAFLGTLLAARTKHAYRSDLRCFYAWAVDHGLLEESPAAKVATVRLPRSLPRPLPAGEVLGLLSFGSRRIRRMVGLAGLAGLRCAEIAALQAEDVWLHTEPATVVVRDGKGAKDRAIPMHPELVSLMRGLPASGPVFPGRCSPTIGSDGVSRSVGEHMERAGIHGTAHQLRHSFGSELARVSGGNLVLVAEWMGHASTTTTMGYVRLTISGGGEIIGGMYGAA